MSLSPARVLALLLLLVAAASAGYLVGARRAQRVTRPTPGEAWTPDPIRVAERRAAPDALMEELGKTGYGASYESAAEEGGVTLHDPQRCQQGWNLVVSAHGPAAFVMDMQGTVLHEWRFPFSSIPGSGTDKAGTWRRARLLPAEDGGGGDLLAIYDGFGLIRIDARSNLKWALRGGYHHDLDLAADGTILVLDREAKVLPEFDAVRPTVEDFVTRVSPDGRVLERISLIAAFRDSEYAPYLARASAGGDVFHTNTLEVLDGALAHLSPHFAAGNVLVSIWGLDVLAIVDLARVRVVWALSGKWHRQHEPSLLANGNILLFDNLGAGEYSRVLEVQPFDQRIVWSYAGDERNGFYSQVLGSTARLANGNTLITESQAATAFEVTPEGEVVWRYVNPRRFEPDDGNVPVLMDVVRLGEGDLAGWLER